MFRRVVSSLQSRIAVVSWIQPARSRISLVAKPRQPAVRHQPLGQQIVQQIPRRLFSTATLRQGIAIVTRRGSPFVLTRTMTSFIPGQQGPRNWSAILGLIGVGAVVLWATSGFIKAVFVGLFKIVFFGAFTAAVLYFAFRVGGRMWRQAYGVAAPWEAPIAVLSRTLPSARTVMNSSAWVGRAVASMLRVVPYLVRTAAAAGERTSQQAQPVVSAAVQRLTADSRVVAVLGAAPYEVATPMDIQVSEQQRAGLKEKRITVRFEVVGPRASGECKAEATMVGGVRSVEDVLFDSLELTVGARTIDVRGGKTKVVDAVGYEER